ncbi:hypothetical protein E4631_03770 [Hymenobacter sp. UV11]|uniref:hypothetical protein n=1 Tax=Hymenobacter sp. UV11 TaxID=1849735 RepID=UPI00105C29E7|nr:hypothetical protein [Hymenobacter sp. UV11]TDN36057.1 hypothetical protein A8B98_11715 [Hymenobacter sp. UV11]TFZ68117.1 hypothetical protein E4631_03770 [Hymenobacter sp. UV11]
MSPYLLDVNLQHAPDEYLAGKWRVESRVLSQADPTTPLAQATFVDLQAGHLRLETATTLTTGNWSVERDSLLSRPYLQLQLGLEQVVALVTRLRRSADGHYRTLVLYFQSGLELFLVHP